MLLSLLAFLQVDFSRLFDYHELDIPMDICHLVIAFKTLCNGNILMQNGNEQQDGNINMNVT